MRVSVSVSVPVDLELTGLKVPSTLSSRNSFRGDGGMAVAILLDFVLSTVLVSFVRLVFAVDVIRELFIFSSMLENTKKGIIIIVLKNISRYEILDTGFPIFTT